MALCTATAALLVLLAGARASLPLPDYVRPCSIMVSDKKLSQCALERANEILPHVLKGDPKYNVPVLDPLHVDRLVIVNGDGPLGLQLVTSDVNIHGLPKAVVSNIVHTTSDPFQDTYVVTVPEVVIHSKYNVSGRILLLPVSGQGKGVIKFKNLKLVYQFDAKFEKQNDGEIYYLPQPGARLDIDVDGMTLQLDNFLNNDKALLENANKFLNEEWREVFESLKPPFVEIISKIITDILSGVFTQVPARSAFLDFEEFMSDERFKLAEKS